MNDLAFPCVEMTHKGRAEHLGLTKRELFAAMVMQGLITSAVEELKDWSYEEYARNAVKTADALAVALHEPEPSKGSNCAPYIERCALLTAALDDIAQGAKIEMKRLLTRDAHYIYANQVYEYAAIALKRSEAK